MFQTLAKVMLTDAMALEATCGRCGHVAAFHRTMAFTYFGPDATPAQVRRRLRCTGCGEKGWAEVQVRAWSRVSVV